MHFYEDSLNWQIDVATLADPLMLILQIQTK